MDVLSHIPVPALLAVAGAAVFLAWRYAGERGAVLVAAISALVIAYTRGRAAEADDRDARDAQDSIDAVVRTEEVRRRVERENRDPKELRQDDGFRRTDVPPLPPTRNIPDRRPVTAPTPVPPSLTDDDNLTPTEAQEPGSPLREDDGFRRPK